MDYVPASDEEDISFPAPVAAPKSNPLEDPYSFEALVAIAPRRDPCQAAKSPYNPTRTAGFPSGGHSTCLDVESISEFTEEQPATHQTTLPSSSIAEFSTAPPAQSTSKARKQDTSKSYLTSLGPTPGERHIATLDEFKPAPFPVIDISDDSEYDGGPKMKGKQPKQDKKAKKPVKDHKPKSEPPRKSKSTNQAEAETVHKVEMGIEAEMLCESKSPTRKRKAPIETAHDEARKKKARKSPTQHLLDRDLALPSLADSAISAIPELRVLLNDAPPSSLYVTNSHITINPSEDTVLPPNKRKRTKKVATSRRDRSTSEAGLTSELKVTEPGKTSKKVPVVDLEDALPLKGEPLPYKLKPVVELTKRRGKRKVVQSGEEVDFVGNAFSGSEDELLIQSVNTNGKAQATSRNPSPRSDREGKKKAPKAKLKSGKTLPAQAPGQGLAAEAPKRLETAIYGALDVPQAEAMSLPVPHELALAKSIPPLPPLRDTNKPSNKPSSTNPPTVAARSPKPKPRRPSMEHTIPKRRDSMTSILQRTGLHAPLSSSRLTVPATARIAPLHLNRKTPPPPPPPVPKPKKNVESDEETDEEEYVGLSEKQIARLKEEKRQRAWYSP